MADFWVSHEESAYLDFILAEDIELGSQDQTFVQELRDAVRRGDTIRFEPPFNGPGAVILQFPPCVSRQTC